jgi:hypothetical protein
LVAAYLRRYKADQSENILDANLRANGLEIDTRQQRTRPMMIL